MGDTAAVEAAPVAVAAVGEKRGAASAELAEGGPEAKIQVTEAAENDQEVEQKDEPDADADMSLSEHLRPSSFPVTLGLKTFDSVDMALMYFRSLATSWPEGLLVNEFEHKVLADLLRTCHPRPRSKILDGVVGFKVGMKRQLNSKCFHVVRKDGTEEDFSYLKCLTTVAGYDLVDALRQKKAKHGEIRGPGGDGRGRGRGGGRGGRGRGGRRGGRGRGRGRN